jgi:sodium/proline symporter
VIATAIALVEVHGIYWFVLFAWSGLGAAFGPVILCSLFWKGMTRAGALAGMLAGFLTVVVWVVWVKDHAYGLYEAVPGFAAGFLAIVVVSRMTTHDDPGSLESEG